MGYILYLPFFGKINVYIFTKILYNIYNKNTSYSGIFILKVKLVVSGFRVGWYLPLGSL